MQTKNKKPGRRYTSTGRELRSVPGGAAQRRSGDRKKKNRKRERQRFLALLAGAGILVIMLAVFLLVRKNGMEVFVGDTSVGIIKKNSVTVEVLKNTVTAQLENERGTKVQLNEEITFKPVHAQKMVTIDHIATQVREAVTYKVQAASITADGAEIAVLNNEEEANALLQEIVEEYIDPENANIDREASGFEQNVQVSSRFVDSSEILSVDEVRKKLTEGTKTQKAYTVASKDTLSKIATNAGMTVEELLAANPGMTIDSTLRVGQEINIMVNVPFLSVKTVENATFTEKLEKTTEYRDDNTKSKSYKKVIQQGKDGQKEVTVQIIRINGFEQEQKKISEKPIVEAVPEIIVRGTK